MTFDVHDAVFLYREHRWLDWHEIFAECRECHKSTIFLVRMTLKCDGKLRDEFNHDPKHIVAFKHSLSPYFEVVRHIGLRDWAKVPAPQHLPAEIADPFNEGAACMSIGCYNAAATMYRLCVDLATRKRLPDASDHSSPQPNDVQRKMTGARIDWLFKIEKLPESLKELAKCISEDGNDGAHRGGLTQEDAEDLQDFTIALLERLFTEPEKIRLATERRLERRQR